MTDDYEREMWQVFIAAPIENVWNTLVRTDEVLPFLFGAVCQTEGELALGKPMRMVSKDGKTVVCFGKVLEFSPPYRFSHTITFAMAADESAGRTTYELKEVQGGTQLTLVSEAIAGTKTAKMSKSGQFIVDNLKLVIETGKPGFATSMIMLTSPLTSLVMPARCRAENWPLSRIAELEGEGR